MIDVGIEVAVGCDVEQMLTSTNMMASELGRKFVGTVNVGWFIVLNATFNNISVISWRSVLLMEKTEVPERSSNSRR